MIQCNSKDDEKGWCNEMILLSTILLNKYAVLDLCCDNDYEMKNLNYIKIIGRFSFNDLSNKKKNLNSIEYFN